MLSTSLPYSPGLDFVSQKIAPGQPKHGEREKGVHKTYLEASESLVSIASTAAVLASFRDSVGFSLLRAYASSYKQQHMSINMLIDEPEPVSLPPNTHTDPVHAPYFKL